MTILCLKGKHEHPVFCLAFFSSSILRAQRFPLLEKVFCFSMTATIAQRERHDCLTGCVAVNSESPWTELLYLWGPYSVLGLPWWLRGWSVCLQFGKPGFNPWLERSPGEGSGTPLQDSCLENPMDGGAWSAAVHGVAKSRTRLSGFTFTLLRPRNMLSASFGLSHLLLLILSGGFPRWH